jgi:hypothetical protein
MLPFFFSLLSNDPSANKIQGGRATDDASFEKSNSGRGTKLSSAKK